ncbi:hypothetical protein BYT27DRAFT_7219425, partial [Phlegmacium glaucopus]
VVLVKIVGLRCPIGQDGWEAVTKEYNEYAKKNGSMERDRIVKTATEKPTGEGEHLQLYQDALQADDDITARSAAITLNDDNQENHSTISLTNNSSSDSEVESKPKVKNEKKTVAKGGKTDKSLVTIKSYKVTNPLEVKSRRTNPAASQANDAISSIGSFFKPESMHERDESQTILAMQQSQLHATQTKICELCAQYSSLQERFFMEGRHADAEARHADAAEASSSKHTPYDDEGMLVRMTPKKNKYGQVASVEVTPA